MEFTLPVTFDIDPAEWAHEFGLDDTAEAVEDIARTLREAAQEGAIAAMLRREWVVMRDAATITVGPVGQDWAVERLTPLLESAQRTVDASGKLKVPAGHVGYLAGLRAALKALEGDA